MTTEIVTFKPSTLQAEAYEAAAQRAGISRAAWVKLWLDYVAAPGGSAEAPPPPVKRTSIKRPKAPEARTKANVVQLSVRPSPGGVARWDKAADRANLGRQPWALAVLDCAAGISDLAAQLDTVRGR